MPGIVRRVTAAIVAGSLVAVSSGAIAASPAPPAAATPAATTPANPWVALSAMTTSSSAANTALRHEEGHMGFPPIAPLIVILGTIALGIYIVTKDDDDDPLGSSVSP